ncbi:MAG: ATPase [Alphaproteobacteria bacterium]|nr:ATPase [Alphaproteobacteria bacterium]MBU1516474.1 ATPase [Alphaproteobacteria bacterium]MBU2094231.1 ATPase [Alphaproteobacteria bacterium]MBU2154192.1 ATPase [Alphaproteobacteria bacterium]MBU2307401.1 ATPase [Alphaproteobacteria bacterium]
MSEVVEKNGAGTAAQLILELLPEPVILVQGREGEAPEIAYGNQAAREVFRIELAGAPLGAALRRPEVLEAIEGALEVGGSAEVAFETIGVQPRFWRAFARPLVSEVRGLRQLVVMLRDETDARRTERMRADFLANASHELRTPLASLAGFVETLRTHAKDDPEARDKFLGIMAQQATRMARLVDDLLSLSRIELNEHIAPSGKVDLARTVQDVSDAIRPLTAERQVTIAIEPSPGVGSVTGDRDQLVQVIQNLVDNAVKYTPPGGKVSVTLQAVANLEGARAPSRAGFGLSLLSPDTGEAQAYVVLRVTDAGPGIARQHLPRLSERFYRVEGQRSGGTGLGLAIVKHVVNRHRGGLTVESAEGEGSTFSVYLPAAVPSS